MAFGFAADHACCPCRQSPPANAVRSVRALLWARIQPIYRVLAGVIAEVADQYDEFLGDETKRKWEWKRRAEQERAFWGAAVVFVASAFALQCGALLLHMVCIVIVWLVLLADAGMMLVCPVAQHVG